MKQNPGVEHDAALWIALSAVDGLGGKGFRQLLQAFGEPAGILATPISQLREHVSEAVAMAISGLASQDLTEDQPRVGTALRWLENPANHLITLADSQYPKALLEISDPPPILYAKGHLDWLSQPALAIVGSRHATPQGEKNAEDFAQALCHQGLCIISGLALGIDGAAHRGALKANGATIAVVGTGLDIVYPARHRELAHQIAEKGLVISEFALGTPSRAQNFPRRNRIISGLSLGCLVVEANVQSGSLITARLAAEQGREVFAIPGSIHSPVAKGCHQLIKQGAKLVDDLQDILDELGVALPVNPPSAQELGATPIPAVDSNPILELMGYDPISMDTLVTLSGLTSDNLSAMLLVLELDNKIAPLPGGRYQRMT